MSITWHASRLGRAIRGLMAFMIGPGMLEGTQACRGLQQIRKPAALWSVGRRHPRELGQKLIRRVGAGKRAEKARSVEGTKKTAVTHRSHFFPSADPPLSLGEVGSLKHIHFPYTTCKGRNKESIINYSMSPSDLFTLGE